MEGGWGVMSLERVSNQSLTPEGPITISGVCNLKKRAHFFP